MTDEELKLYLDGYENCRNDILNEIELLRDPRNKFTEHKRWNAALDALKERCKCLSEPNDIPDGGVEYSLCVSLDGTSSYELYRSHTKDEALNMYDKYFMKDKEFKNKNIYVKKIETTTVWNSKGAKNG